MHDAELVDDLANAINGTLDRELRTIGNEGEFDSDAGSFHKHQFSTSDTAFESIFRFLLLAAGARERETFDRFGWQLYFTDKSQRCSLRWTKRGIQLDLYEPASTQGNPADIAQGIERRLVKAAKQVYKRVITPRLNVLMTRGPVTIVNQYRRYRGMVDFFLREITQPASPIPRQKESTGDAMRDYIAQVTHAAFEPFRLAEERAYRATALVAAYFSWLQHLLIALTAFSPKALEPDFSLDRLLAAPWAEQFDLAFATPHNASTAKLKSELSSVAREFRNPLLHGGGGRHEDGVVVEWIDGQQIMALDPDATTDLYMLWQPSLSTEQVDDLATRIARIDELLQEHPYYEWVAGGAPINFDADRIRLALQAIGNGTAGEFTRLHSDAYDDMINWD